MYHLFLLYQDFSKLEKSIIRSRNENLTESKPITSSLLTIPTHLNIPVSLPFIFLIFSLIFIRVFNLDSFVGFMQQIVFSSILLLFIDNFLCPSRQYWIIYILKYLTISQPRQFILLLMIPFHFSNAQHCFPSHSNIIYFSATNFPTNVFNDCGLITQILFIFSIVFERICGKNNQNFKNDLQYPQKIRRDNII